MLYISKNDFLQTDLRFSLPFQNFYATHGNYEILSESLVTTVEQIALTLRVRRSYSISFETGENVSVSHFASYREKKMYAKLAHPTAVTLPVNSQGVVLQHCGAGESPPLRGPAQETQQRPRQHFL